MLAWSCGSSGVLAASQGCPILRKEIEHFRHSLGLCRGRGASQASRSWAGPSVRGQSCRTGAGVSPEHLEGPGVPRGLWARSNGIRSAHSAPQSGGCRQRLMDKCPRIVRDSVTDRSVPEQKGEKKGIPPVLMSACPPIQHAPQIPRESDPGEMARNQAHEGGPPPENKDPHPMLWTVHIQTDF